MVKGIENRLGIKLWGVQRLEVEFVVILSSSLLCS